MPNKYIRKATDVRGNWTEEALQAAINAVKRENYSVYKAAKTFGIPRKTLERRIKNNHDKKGPMGPPSVFGSENEAKLVSHIKTMQANGFPITIDDVRTIAFQFAEQLKIKHKFNRTKQKAGYDWLQLFLKRNPDIRLRKSEVIAEASVEVVIKEEVDVP